MSVINQMLIDLEDRKACEGDSARDDLPRSAREEVQNPVSASKLPFGRALIAMFGGALLASIVWLVATEYFAVAEKPPQQATKDPSWALRIPDLALETPLPAFKIIETKPLEPQSTIVPSSRDMIAAAPNHAERSVREIDLTTQGTFVNELEITDESPASVGQRPASVKKEPSLADIPAVNYQGQVKKVAAEDRRPDRLQLARRDLAYGRDAAGIEVLRELLIEDPLRTEVRLELAQALIRGGKAARADMVLRVGLQIDPRNHELAELLAHLFVQRGRHEVALETLNNFAPGAAEDPVYHAFIGALAQKTGDWQQAARAYHRALDAQPTRGAWWLGLAVALNHIGEAEEAREAFEQALGLADLTDKLRNYAHRAIARIDGEQS
ncbi:MAG: tetratricopeptide repeat protein [Pseudomonadota bacterium]